MNIFGKEIEEYRIFADACPNMNRQQMQDAIRLGGRDINWQLDLRPQSFRNDAEAITAGFGLLQNNFMAIQAESDEILRRLFIVSEFVPVNTAVPEGATSNATNIVHKFGKGKFINKDGSDVEKAEAGLDRIAYPIGYGGLIGSWSLQELRESVFAGVPLNNETLMAALEGCNDHIQEIAITGSTQKGFTGFLNSSGVPVFAGTVPNLLTATADEIILFINTLISDLMVTTNEAALRLRGSDLQINLPTRSFNRLSSTKHGTDNERSIMQYLMENNSWTARTGRNVVFKSLPEATTGGAGGDARLSLYIKDRRVLEMDMPIAPRITRLIDEAYSTDAPYEYSVSGVNFKRPTMAIYADGVEG